MIEKLCTEKHKNIEDKFENHLLFSRYKKFDNIVKSKNRYKWFLHKYHNLDSQILQFNTLKYTKNKYSEQQRCRYL